MQEMEASADEQRGFFFFKVSFASLKIQVKKYYWLICRERKYCSFIEKIRPKRHVNRASARNVERPFFQINGNEQYCQTSRVAAVMSNNER